MTTIHVMNVQLFEKFRSAPNTNSACENVLVGVHSNIRIRSKDGSDPNSGAEIRQRVDTPAIPGCCETEGPDKIRYKKDDRRLV